MAAKIRRGDDELPLSPPVLYILLALGDRKRHGYDIMQDVADRTGGKITLLPGSLYSTLQRMVASGLIEETNEARHSRRRYYRITKHGRSVARAEVERMATLIGLARDKKLTSSELVRTVLDS